jgi:hypothetical protein
MWVNCLSPALTDIWRRYAGVFTQEMLEHLREETPEFIKKDEWPPQSPDLNPMDYTMWDSLSEKVYAGNLRTKSRNGQKYTEIYLAESRKSIGAWKN